MVTHLGSKLADRRDKIAYALGAAKQQPDSPLGRIVQQSGITLETINKADDKAINELTRRLEVWAKAEAQIKRIQAQRQQLTAQPILKSQGKLEEAPRVAEQSDIDPAQKAAQSANAPAVFAAEPAAARQPQQITEPLAEPATQAQAPETAPGAIATETPILPPGVQIIRQGEPIPPRERGQRQIPIEVEKGDGTTETVLALAPERINGQRVNETMLRPTASQAVRPQPQVQTRNLASPLQNLASVQPGSVSARRAAGEEVQVFRPAERPRYDPETQKAVIFKGTDRQNYVALVPKNMTRADATASGRAKLASRIAQPAASEASQPTERLTPGAARLTEPIARPEYIDRRLAARTPGQASEADLRTAKRDVDRVIEDIRKIETGERSRMNVAPLRNNLASRLTTIARNQPDIIQDILDYTREQQETLKRPLFAPNNKVWLLGESAQARAAEALPKPDFVLEAEQRLRDAASGRLAGIFGSRQLLDLAISVGWKVYRTGARYLEWARKAMAEDKRVRPYLRQVWERIQRWLGSGFGRSKMLEPIKRPEIDALLKKKPELRTGLEQNPKLLDLIRNDGTVRNLLVQRPEVMESLLKQPGAIDVIERGVIRAAGAMEGVAAPPAQNLTTPLSDAQLDISKMIGKATPKSKSYQARFDPEKIGNAKYTKRYLKNLYKQAEEAQKELTEIADKLAEATKGEAASRPGKHPSRIKDKIKTDYDGDASMITDLAGSKIVYQTLDDLYHGLESVKEKLGDKIKIVYFEDRFISPMRSGYRDIMLKLRMSNKHIAELRLHLKSIEDAAVVERPVYEVRRALVAIAKEEGRDMTPAEEALDQALLIESQALYAKALKKRLKTP